MVAAWPTIISTTMTIHMRMISPTRMRMITIPPAGTAITMITAMVQAAITMCRRISAVPSPSVWR